MASLNNGGPIIRRRDVCRLCHGRSLDLVLSLTATPLANSVVSAEQLDISEACYPLDVHACRGCGHVQLLDVIDPGVLFNHYVYTSGASPAYVAYLEEYANGIISKLGLTTESMVIEIGSNDGTLLAHFKKAGMKVLGVDPAENLSHLASEAGVETRTAFFTPNLAEEIKEDIGPVPLLIANHVFAHADDLEGILEGVRLLLTPDGVFVFEVSYLLDVYRDVLFDTIYHEHLSYHTVGPLVEFFHRNDMELIDVQRVQAQGGSLRGVVQLAGGPRTKESSVQQFVSAELREIGEDLPAAFRLFEQRIDRERVRLTELLAGLRKEGSQISGYGAPAKATTLMYHFQLDASTLEYIVDDNPIKQGMLTPGLHVPIVSSDELARRTPDFLLILAWNFAEPIMAAHRDFSEGGGKFIVPLPDVKVY